MLNVRIDNNKDEAIKKHIYNIVIGSIHISEVKLQSATQGIVVTIEANYSVKQNNKRTRYIVTEKWNFFRDAGVLSHEPEKMRELSCPNCGAAANFTDAGVCESCGTLIKPGEMQWELLTSSIQNQEVFETGGLAYYAPEKGTGYETLFQKNYKNEFEVFAKNNNVEFEVWKNNFETKVAKQYFTKIYDAWSTNNLNVVRNLLTDRLYESFDFWIKNYKRKKLLNKLDNVKIYKVEFVKVDTDKFYESVTIRIAASCFDYVQNKEGKVEGGSKSIPRVFTEYWTFIRRSGVKIDDYDYSKCPNCGAPANKIGQTGICDYCDTKISNGDFSWVLSIITQDEVYKG